MPRNSESAAIFIAFLGALIGRCDKHLRESVDVSSENAEKRIQLELASPTLTQSTMKSPQALVICVLGMATRTSTSVSIRACT
jgi:hypothetical protein